MSTIYISEGLFYRHGQITMQLASWAAWYNESHQIQRRDTTVILLGQTNLLCLQQATAFQSLLSISTYGQKLQVLVNYCFVICQLKGIHELIEMLYPVKIFSYPQSVSQITLQQCDLICKKGSSTCIQFISFDNPYLDIDKSY